MGINPIGAATSARDNENEVVSPFRGTTTSCFCTEALAYKTWRKAPQLRARGSNVCRVMQCSSGSVPVPFRVRCQAVKVPMSGGFPHGHLNKEGKGIKALPGDLLSPSTLWSGSEYGWASVEGVVRVSVAHLIERPTDEPRAPTVLRHRSSSLDSVLDCGYPLNGDVDSSLLDVAIEPLPSQCHAKSCKVTQFINHW